MQVQAPLGWIVKAAVSTSALLLGASVHAQTSAPIKASASTPAKPSTADADKKICATEGKLGSRIARKVCRTAAEWELDRQSRQQRAFDPHQ